MLYEFRITLYITQIYIIKKKPDTLSPNNRTIRDTLHNSISKEAKYTNEGNNLHKAI